MSGNTTSLRVMRESFIALALIVFGLIGFPALIFVIGQQLIGEYDEGLMAFYESIGAALTRGDRYAWILVLSPYLGVMLLRLAFRLRKRRQRVS